MTQPVKSLSETDPIKYFKEGLKYIKDLKYSDIISGRERDFNESRVQNAWSSLSSNCNELLDNFDNISEDAPDWLSTVQQINVFIIDLLEILDERSYSFKNLFSSLTAVLSLFSDSMIQRLLEANSNSLSSMFVV